MLRSCARCGITDDHPRHEIGALDGGTPAGFHMDCHAEVGCRVCLHQLRDADGATGAALRTHLRALEPLTPDQVADLYHPAPQEGLTHG